jgi:hypothetical protein
MFLLNASLLFALIKVCDYLRTLYSPKLHIMGASLSTSNIATQYRTTNKFRKIFVRLKSHE